MKKPRTTSVLVVVAMMVIAYLIGWHTYLGRFARGISSVAFVNRSDQQLKYVTFYLSDSSGRQISRQFDYLQPHHSVVVRVRASDLILGRIVCEQDQRTFSYDEGANVTRGEVFLVALDSRGKMSHEYGD